MKIRTDFVTNSSSSSFIVNLTMELKNGTSIVLDSEDWSGDYECKCLHVTAEDAEQSKLFEEVVLFEESDDFFYCDVTEYIGDIQFSHLNLAEVLHYEDVNQCIEKIERAFVIPVSSENMQKDIELEDLEEDCEEDDSFEQYDEATQEAILEAKANIEKIANVTHAFLKDNLTSIQDIKEISLCMEFGGRGEFLAGPEGILDKIFGYDSWEIQEILEEQEDESVTLEALKQLPCMKHMSEQAILEIIHFWNTCDYAPCGCNIGQELEDGEVRFSISFDE